jgi:alpha-amylase/alpha-mannosidase (GH57 family)
MSAAHLLGLHMHQPPGNLELLIASNEWEARQILLCYERPLRYAARYLDVARFCVGFSGVLLEQLLDPAIIARYASIVDIPKMLEGYRNAPNIELAGMGYYHPIFPLIPVEDWDEQIARGRNRIAEIFGRAPTVFWPPEMAFTMEMIPALVRQGYRYVVIDSVHLKLLAPLPPEEVIYRLHVAEYQGARIAVIPRDRDLSNAQESGLDPVWFANEVTRKASHAPKPALVTTWTDGENGGWFRQTHEEAGFWGHFFAPYMERVRSGQAPVRTISIAEYAAANPPTTAVEIRTGEAFSQWAGSPAQRKALEEIWRLRRAYAEMSRARQAPRPQALQHSLNEAREALLKAETSCFLFWGDSWVPKLYEQIAQARRLLKNLSA